MSEGERKIERYIERKKLQPIEDAGIAKLYLCLKNPDKQPEGNLQ